MNLLPVRPPNLLRSLHPDCIWRMSARNKKIYITFDDGPIPEVTPWVLDLLKEYGVKATFFCVGDNVNKHPTIYKRILAEGHAVGNHTHNHVSGWNRNTEDYLKNVDECNQILNSKNFRPPYGRLTPAQRKQLVKKFRVIFWDVLSYDYSASVKPEQCLENVMKGTRNGSIIVFHDSIKANNNIRYALPKYFEFVNTEGFESAIF